MHQNSRDLAFVSRIIFSSGISFSPGETVFLAGCSFRSLSNVEEVVEKNSFFFHSAAESRESERGKRVSQEWMNNCYETEVTLFSFNVQTLSEESLMLNSFNDLSSFFHLLVFFSFLSFFLSLSLYTE